MKKISGCVPDTLTDMTIEEFEKLSSDLLSVMGGLLKEALKFMSQK